MIEIKLVTSPKIDDICLKHKLQRTNLLQVYVAYENGEELGSCGFEINKDAGTLVFISMSDFNLAPIEDGLLRLTLAYMFDRGVDYVSCGGGTESKMLKTLGFKEKDGVNSLLLSQSFLTQGC